MVMRVVDEQEMKRASAMWWVMLAMGIIWLLISVVVLRFDETSVKTVGVLIGVVLIVAGLSEFMVAALAFGWRWAHTLLGILFVIGGIACFMHPKNAFWALASILGFLLILKGSVDIIVSVMSKAENSVWWLGLTAGILEILLAFWVSVPDSLLVSSNRRAALLILWVGFMALFRGIGQIAMSFALHRAGKEMAAT
jgi:uncharacterized membrane protein HdeD (DUF308 family)